MVILDSSLSPCAPTPHPIYLQTLSTLSPSVLKLLWLLVFHTNLYFHPCSRVYCKHVSRLTPFQWKGDSVTVLLNSLVASHRAGGGRPSPNSGLMCASPFSFSLLSLFLAISFFLAKLIPLLLFRHAKWNPQWGVFIRVLYLVVPSAGQALTWCILLLSSFRSSFK